MDNIEIEMKSLNNRVVAANKENEILKNKYELEVLKNKKLKAKIEDTKDLIFDLDCRIIQNEQYSRRESVIISGIPDNILHNDLEPTVLRTLKAIGLKNISSYEITTCYRLYKKKK